VIQGRCTPFSLRALRTDACDNAFRVHIASIAPAVNTPASTRAAGGTSQRRQHQCPSFDVHPLLPFAHPFLHGHATRSNRDPESWRSAASAAVTAARAPMTRASVARVAWPCGRQPCLALCIAKPSLFEKCRKQKCSLDIVPTARLPHTRTKVGAVAPSGVLTEPHGPGRVPFASWMRNHALAGTLTGTSKTGTSHATHAPNSTGSTQATNEHS